MIKRIYAFTCDNIYHVPVCHDTFHSFKLARFAGWSISHDRKKAYCPECTRLFKHVGRSGNKAIEIRAKKCSY